MLTNTIDAMESICRLCCITYAIPKMNHLFDVRSTRLLEKLKYFACFSFKIGENDGFPPYICKRCTGLLELAYQFKLICESAEANFWALSQSNSIDEPEDDITLTVDHRDDSLECVEVITDSHATEANYRSDSEIETQMLCCDLCGLQITDEIDLIIHMEMHETTLLTEKRKLYEKVSGSMCDICGESFERKRELERHMKNVHHPMKKIKRNPKAFWICETCGKDFKSQYALKYHISGAHVEAVEKNYSCDLCDFKCRRARYLLSHALKHSGEKPHRCEECGLAFGFHGSLNRHVQAVHRHEKRHKCTICDRNFKTKFRLKEHSNTHSGQDPHECSQCSRTYRYKNSLSRHLKKCHADVLKLTER